MKTLGHLLTFLIILYLVVAFTSNGCEKKYIHLSDDFKGGVILEKSNDYTFGYEVYILKKDGKVESIVKVYEIEYNKYKVGDTIK